MVGKTQGMIQTISGDSRLSRRRSRRISPRGTMALPAPVLLGSKSGRRSPVGLGIFDRGRVSSVAVACVFPSACGEAQIGFYDGCPLAKETMAQHLYQIVCRKRAAWQRAHA